MGIIGHGIYAYAIVLCLEEATLKMTRSMSSSLKYLQSNQASKRIRTSEREALSEKPEEDAMKRVAYQDSREAKFLSKLRKYVQLMSPVDDPVTYRLHDKALFYYFITAFVGSLFIGSSSLRWWLWTLGIMVAFSATRICWSVATSALFARDSGKNVASEALEVVLLTLLRFATLAVAVTYQAMPDALKSDIQDEDEHHPHPGSRHLERPVVAFFFYINCVAFMASVDVLLLLRRTRYEWYYWHGHRLCSWALWIGTRTGLALIGLPGVIAIWSRRRRTTSICFSALLLVAVLPCIGLLALQFLLKPADNWDRNIQETLQSHSKLWHTAGSDDHHHPAIADPRVRKEGTVLADQRLHNTRRYLLFFGILAASITYQTGLKPPGGFWQANDTTDGLHHCHARTGDTVIIPHSHSMYPGIHQAFFYLNAIAFAASLFILILLLSSGICRTQGIKYNALQVFMTLDDLLGSISAYAGGSCSESTDPAVDDKDDANRSIKCGPLEATWHVACAAPHHMTGNRSLLLGLVLNGNDGEGIVVQPAANGEVPLRVEGSGSVRTDSIALDDVWYVPGLDSNLVCTGQLARQGCAVSLGPDGCRITRGGALVGTARFTEACQFELDFLKLA